MAYSLHSEAQDPPDLPFLLLNLVSLVMKASGEAKGEK
jgi:hypothetical protein